MARAWIIDQWVKDSVATLPDGETLKISPTSDQLRAIKTLPDHFRTAKFGKGSRWAVGWYEPTAEGGQKLRRLSYRKRIDAEQAAAELEEDLRTGRYIDPAAKNKPVREAADEWLAAKKDIKDSTWRRYRRELDNHVIPKWGNTPLGAITRPGIDAWVGELQAGAAPFAFDPHGRYKGEAGTSTPLKPSTLAHLVRATFGGVLRHAIAERWIGINPLANVKLPRDESDIDDDLPFLSYLEIETVADEAATIHKHTADRVLVLLLAYSGPRIGEATAIKIKDLDLDNLRIRIMRTWTTDKDGKRKLGPSKTWQKRWLPIPAFLVEEVRELTVGRDPEDFLFTSSRGGAINNKNWYTRIWKPARDGVGLPSHITVHDLRHVAATNAIAAGADVKLVQTMLGHKDATETLNTYSHLWPDKTGDVVALMASKRAEMLDLAA